MCFTGKDPDKSRKAVEAGIEKKKVVFSQAVIEFFNQFMFRSGGLAVNVAKGSTTDKIEEATEFNGDRAQAFLAVMSSEGLPKRFGFRQSQCCLINSQSAQSVPAIVFGIAGSLQLRNQRFMQPG